MKAFLLTLAATAAVTLSATASAADFTGPRVDIHVGRDKINDLRDRTAPGKPDADGVAFGGQVGYDTALTDKLTIGAEAGVDFSNASVAYTSDSTIFPFRNRIGALRDLSAGARLGVKASDNMLVYGGVAYTNAGLNSYFRDDTGAERSRSKLDGYRLSGGALIGLTEKVALKAEYRWSNYEGNVTRSNVLVGASYRF